MTKVNLFGYRVLLEKATPKPGSILVPESVEDIHKMAKVVCVGDGLTADGKHKESLVAINDIIFFQTNAMLAAACTYQLGKECYISLMQGDLIARLKTENVTFEEFEMLGDWCLLKLENREPGTESRIVVPETVKMADSIFWSFQKAGLNTVLPFAKGTEVVINTNRANPIMIDRTEYAYIDKQFILGWVDK